MITVSHQFDVDELVWAQEHGLAMDDVAEHFRDYMKGAMIASAEEFGALR